MWAISLVLLASTLPIQVAASPSIMKTRSVQTDAVCQSAFTWMDNSHSFSPCYVAAQVMATCGTGDWTIHALPQGKQYEAPNSTTANLCSCSWAAYNLLSACTACQGLDASILTWAGYSAPACSGKTANEYFPSNITLSSDTSIPYWAAVDVTQWNNARFDAGQAKALDDQGHPDFVQGATSSGSHKSNAGPIAGGVVGGVLGIAALIGVIWLLRRRRAVQKARGEKGGQWDHGGQILPYNGRPTHERNTSAPSTKTSFFGRPMLGLRHLMGSPMSPTETLRESSIGGTPEHPLHPRLPDLPGRIPERTEDMITPFSLTTPQRTPPGLITPGSSKEGHYGYFDGGEHGMRPPVPPLPASQLADGSGSSSSGAGAAIPRPDGSFTAGSDRVVSVGDISIASMGSGNHTFENAFPSTSPNPPAYSPSPVPGSGHGHGQSSSISSLGHRKGQTSGDSLESLGSGFAHVTNVGADRMSTVPEASEGRTLAGTGTSTGMTAAMMEVIRAHDRPTEHRDGVVDMPDIA
ncbi:hypothetical protein DL96DRAFT_1620297 [Flagelloscypha sp. PMI_526]|nr:hypothetical protein DL96DRAFT_1620297 [Flagelloscypha sp. PMI_526]